MMRKTLIPRKSAVPQSSNRNTSNTTRQSTQSTGGKKRTLKRSLRKSTINSGNQDRLSDISGDDAEETIPLKKRRVSIIYSYADKLSEVEYRCSLCMKVIRL